MWRARRSAGTEATLFCRGHMHKNSRLASPLDLLEGARINLPFSRNTTQGHRLQTFSMFLLRTLVSGKAGKKTELSKNKTVLCTHGREAQVPYWPLRMSDRFSRMLQSRHIVPPHTHTRTQTHHLHHLLKSQLDVIIAGQPKDS